MADLRIVDAPEIPTENITGEEKLPTGGSGNYSISLDSLADYTKTKKDLADNNSVDGKVNGVRQELDAHIEDLLNPHQVTKGQIGLGNVDNTADADKPVSNSAQAAIISAVTPKADKTYVDNQLTLKANKADVYTKQESSDLVNNSISTALTPVNASLDLAKRGITNRYDSSLTYNSGERVVLTNGDIVKSTIDGNTNNPNVDMTGWVDETLAITSVNKNLFYTQARPFSSFDTAMDVSPIVQAYANSLNDGDTLIIPDGKWAIKTACVINKAVNIKCDGELVVSGDSASVFRLEQAPAFTLTGADLTQLPKKGDTKLYISGTPFDPAEHFFTLVSTEIEIVRIGYADPYYKNETLDFIDSSFNLRGQIDLDYTDASKLTIYVYKKRRPTNVQLRMSMQPNVGQTTGARILEAFGVNNICWDVFIDRSTSQKVAGTSFLYSRCVHFTMMPTSKILGGQSDSSDSYAFLNISSSYILHFGGEYTDQGNTAKKERGYAARHGKYVFFQAGFFNGIDDHYGHHYYISNMNFHNRGIGISGGHVTIENCNQYNVAEPLYFLRTDTPYCDGDLRILNCSAKVLLSLSSANNVAYNSKFKMFDRIVLRDIKAHIGASNFINVGTFFAQNTNTVTENVEIENLSIYRTGSGRVWNDSDEVAKFKKISLSDFDVKSDTTISQTITRFVAVDTINIINCSKIDGALLAADINIVRTKYGYAPAATNMICATSKLILDDTEIVSDGGIYSTKPTLGEIYLYNSRINSWRFFAVADFQTKVSIASGTTSNTANPINFDLFSYNKNAIDRVATVTKTIGTLALGASTSETAVACSGARLGDFVKASFTAINSNGLRINAWVATSNSIRFFVENPAANPNGSQTVASAEIRFSVTSN